MVLNNCAYCQRKPSLDKHRTIHNLRGEPREAYRYICNCDGGHHGQFHYSKDNAKKVWNEAQEGKLKMINKIISLVKSGVINSERLNSFN